MARIPAATRESVPASQRQQFDQYAAEHNGAPTQGPLSAMLNVPEVLQRGEHLRAYLRGDECSLPLPTRELAMLVTARELDCQYIWNAHAAAGRRLGLRDTMVDCLRDKVELTDLSPDEEAVVNYGREFFRTHRVSQATFDATMAQFGVQGITELTNLMAYYALLAFNVNAFEVELPEGITEKPLPV
ncbi:MAG: carboxymuconolactone decarboxylase family protein, partial [Dehalococcoidia bacterium]